MDTRVKRFLFKKAIGLLDVWKGRPLTKSPGDIESGFLNATQHSPTKSQSQQRRNSEADNSCPQGTALASSTRHVELTSNQQPQFTEGPARFVVVNDGSRDCLALLVTETFVAKSRDLYEDSHHLSGKQGPLQQVRRDARDAETSMNLAKEALEVAEGQKQADELTEKAEKRKSTLLEARQRKDEIEKGAKLLENSIAASREYTQWVLETAMGEADLLEPHRPLTPFMAADTEEDEDPNEIPDQPYNENEIQNATGDADVPRQPEFSANDEEVPANSDEAPADEDSIRQAAWEDYNDKLETFHEVQAMFDNRQESYERDLAKYQQGFANGIYNISRSEFDRSKIRYGQKLTRALIDTEEAFEVAKEHAQAVGAIGSDYEQTNYFGYHEESMPEGQMASYIASKDFSDIYTWMTNVSETCDPNDNEPVEIDDWDVKEVDHTDSISQIDFEEYRKPMDQWQYECALARGDGPEEYYLGPVNIEFLERRHTICN